MSAKASKEMVISNSIIVVLTNLFHKLTNLGEKKPSERWTVDMILGNLSRSYHTLLTALETGQKTD